ncbi:Uncharacterised protein [Vibrio furnissii]|nr:Uncharacterised protein [Vibrio furnissii]
MRCLTRYSVCNIARFTNKKSPRDAGFFYALASVCRGVRRLVGAHFHFV